jgi:pimeloyl-ACP methyl ester carboxylesterase
MHLVCVGPTDTGEPTILLEAGGGGDSLSWDRILPVMQATHRLCAYDRAGLGRSDPPVEASRTSSDQVADLRALLGAAAVSGPFLLGAHSYGATVATLFTQAAPDEVVALLFIDPENARVEASWLDALPPPAAGEPASVTELRNQLEVFGTDPTLNPEHQHLRSSFAEAAAALDAPGPLFGDRPVVVLSAETTPGPQFGLPPDLSTAIDEIWAAGQQELADESTAGSVATVDGAGHDIQVDQPLAVVAALESMLNDLATS